MMNRNTRAIFAPVTHDGVAKGTSWDYHDHSRLAYGLIQNEDSIFPSFAGEEVEQTLLAECIRQASLLALQRNPELKLGPSDTSAESIRTAMKEQSGIVSDDMQQSVSRALDRADNLASSYFDRNECVSKTEGGKLIDEIIEENRRRMAQRIEESSRMN